MGTVSDAVAHIRSFNRFYTNILGLLNQHILDSDFSLTEARVLLEINKAGHCTAHELGKKLAIDYSYMSRMLKKFENRGLLSRTQAPQDNRFNRIELLDGGRRAVEELERRSDEQILHLIRFMPPEELAAVQEAMALIRDRFSEAMFPVTLRDFVESDVEYIIRRHVELYQAEYGLSAVFAGDVDRGVRRLAANLNAAHECILIPEIEGRPLGSIAVARADDETAQLRYFLLEPEARGHGLGYRLVDAALAFCRRAGYTHVFLETFSKLTAARTIYQSRGFRITYTHQNPEWGEDVLEERWELDL